MREPAHEWLTNLEPENIAAIRAYLVENAHLKVEDVGQRVAEPLLGTLHSCRVRGHSRAPCLLLAPVAWCLMFLGILSPAHRYQGIDVQLTRRICKPDAVISPLSWQLAKNATQLPLQIPAEVVLRMMTDHIEDVEPRHNAAPRNMAGWIIGTC